MSHECRPSKKGSMTQMEGRSDLSPVPETIWRGKLAGIGVREENNFLVPKAGRLRIPGILQLQQLEGSTSEATHGIPQLITSFIVFTKFNAPNIQLIYGSDPIPKKDSNHGDHLLRLPTLKKKHPKEKRLAQLLHVPRKNISNKLVDYHHFKAQKVIPRKKAI